MVSEPRAASRTTNRGDGTASGASARGLSRLLQCHASIRQACVQGGAGLSPWPAVSIGSVVLRLNDSGRRYMSRNGPRRVGDLRTPAQQACSAPWKWEDRRCSCKMVASDVVRTRRHDVGSRARRYIVFFTIGRSRTSGGWLLQALWSSTEGQSREPANPQPWLREQWLDPCGCGCGVSSALGIRGCDQRIRVCSIE